MSELQTAARDLPTAARVLRTYRAAALLTQAQLAERASCARETIAYAETGRPLSAQVALRLAEALGCRLDALLTPTDDERRSATSAAVTTSAEQGPSDAG